LVVEDFAPRYLKCYLKKCRYIKAFKLFAAKVVDKSKTFFNF